MPVSHRFVTRLLATPAALRAQALAIVVLVEIGLAAATGGATQVPAALPDTAATFVDHRPLPPRQPDVRTFVPDELSAALLPPAPPKPAPVPRPKPNPKLGKRWVPEGTGMWTYQWDKTEGGNAARIVSRAREVGLTHLYVRTGTRKGGFDGGPALRRLLPATRGTGIRVIAWDFPQLADPAADARRLAAAASFTVPGAPRVAAVAPDIETGAEGTRLTDVRVAIYLSTLRRLLPKEVSIIGVIPWPSEKRAGKYPYGQVAKYSDALAPMAYWVNRDPATVVTQTMYRLRQFRKPILPIGQAYDPRIDVPNLPWGAPSRGQVAAFLGTARKLGAPAASLWVWQFADLDHWRALQAAKALYAPVR
ncbi:MAG: hypothetical protein QOE45_1573 [Frankiaceae bacterium]|jgi:hypothetical protein|nr:hypothetical protein [Frankiaceae bacterium]